MKVRHVGGSVVVVVSEKVIVGGRVEMDVGLVKCKIRITKKGSTCSRRSCRSDHVRGGV